MKYAIISVPIEVKKVLEKAKGTDEWGSFSSTRTLRLKSLKAFEELSFR
jgi:hypothetical protein